MPNGFDNPYLTQEETPFDINALLQYITDVEGGWGLGGGNPMSNWGFAPEYGQQEMSFNVNLPTYRYQGMSPEIMQALGNVFTVGDEGFDPQMFGEDFIMSQIQSQIPGLTEEDLAGMITETPLEEQIGTGGWGGSFDPTIESISDWDYGDMSSALGFTDIYSISCNVGKVDP